MGLRENLARVMKEQGLSAYQLGKESGVAPNHIGAILNGKIRTPRSDVLAKLADRLDISADELLGRRDYPAVEQSPSVVRDHDPPRPEHIILVPVVGVAVGGSPQDAAEVVGEEYSLLHHLYKPGRFVIRLFGDSMHPTY